MKKIWFVVIPFLVIGCAFGTDLSNTPTKKVEEVLFEYQTLDKDVLKDLEKVAAEEENLNSEQREKYISIMKKHYQNLVYTIKDETIDGNDAVIEVEIEVTDYAAALKKIEDYRKDHEEQFYNEEGNYDISLFMDYKLKELASAKEKVIYTLEIDVNKVDGNWKVNNLSKTDRDKINGVYED